MASMISYVGHMRYAGDGVDPSSVFDWNKKETLSANLTRLSCPYGQLKVLLEQSLAIAYYVRFMGLRCHEVVNEFIEELNNDIAYRFSRNCGHVFQDNFKKIFQTLNNLVKFNRGGNWTDVDIGLVSEFLFDGRQMYGVPVIWSDGVKGTLIPFLMFMNKGNQEGYGTFADQACGICSFYVSNNWTNENYSDTVACWSLEVRHHAIGRSFSSVRTPLDQLTNCPILAILSHFDWSTKSLESGIGIIAELCFHKDIERYGTSLTHLLAYCFNNALWCGLPQFNIAGYTEDVDPIEPSFKNQLFSAFLAFVNFCTQQRGMAVVDKAIIAKAFGSLASTKQQRESVAYLRDVSASASADDLRSFKQVMGAVEALQLISQSPTLMPAQTDNQVTGATEDATQGSDDNKDAKPTEGSDPDQAADGKKEGTEPEEGKEDDNSEPSPDEDGADDLPSDDTTGAGEDLPMDDQGSSDDQVGSGDPGTDQSTSAQPASTPETQTSDDTGIPFEFVTEDSATVDSVLFREEMDKFLTNVLTNPPKCLSPQDVDTLTALKRFWLHCLSIDTIKGIVEACIRLPKTVKSSLRKSTEIKQ